MKPVTHYSTSKTQNCCFASFKMKKLRLQLFIFYFSAQLGTKSKQEINNAGIVLKLVRFSFIAMKEAQIWVGLNDKVLPSEFML